MTYYFTAEQVYQSLKEENEAMRKFCHEKQAELETLRTGYAAARLEIESLRAALAAGQATAAQQGVVEALSGVQELTAAPAIGDELRDTLVAVSAAIAERDDRTAQKMIREILAASPTPPAEQQAIAPETEFPVSEHGVAITTESGAVYAELPQPDSWFHFTPQYWGNKLRDFADATHALRASHVQAPAQAAPQPTQAWPIAPDVAADLERSDWTPEEALRWYAAGKHYDTVPNGDGSSSARILDHGAVASNALKSMSREYAERKSDVALQEPAPAAQGDALDAARYRYLRDVPMDQWPAELLTAVRLQQNAKWDTNIDAACAAQEGK